MRCESNILQTTTRIVCKSKTISNSINSLTNFNIWKKPLLFSTFSFSILLSVNSLCQNLKLQNFKSSLILESNCQLGEGAFWDSERKKLWFVDIENGLVHQFDPKNGKHYSFPTGQKVGTLVPSLVEEKLILGLQNGIYESDFAGKSIGKICTIKELSSNQRLNDGKCDPNGRFWVGGLNMDKEKKTSHLFMMDEKRNSKVKLDSVSISNGIVWSKNGRKLFYIDTPTRTVKSFDFEIKSGKISNPKILIKTPDSLGWPDGMAIDEKNNLWIGMWGGSCVSIWSSDNGEYLGKVFVDAKNVTSCAFGGVDKKTLYITTAKQGLSKEDLEKFPLSGHLFQTEVDIAGLQMPYWKFK